MAGDEAIIAALTHMSSEIKGLRQEVRKVIELEAEARHHKAALGRAFAEIAAVDARVTAVDLRVQHIEGQGPISNLVRIAVFAMIALGMAAILAAVFGGVIRAPAAMVGDRSSPTIGPPRQPAELYPRSQP